MADLEKIEEQPRLYIDSDDRMVQRRVQILDTEIHARPELYIIAAATVGHLSLSKLVDAVPTQGLIDSQSELRTPKERLRLLLQNRDAKFLLFDMGSDAAIYEDSHVKEVIADLHKAPQRVTVSGDKHIYRHPTDPEEIRNHLDMHKIFLYASRVRAWKQQQQAEQTAVPQQKPVKEKQPTETSAVPKLG